MFNLNLPKPITFAEWGEQWMDLIITPALIEDNLKRMISPTVQVSFPAVNGDGTVKLGAVTRTNEGDMHKEIVFLAPLTIDLKLSIGVQGLYAETYTIQARITMRLVLLALPMLVLYIHCPDIEPSTISVDTSGKGIVDNIVNLENQLQQYIAKEINNQIAASSHHRRIDVLAIVREALKTG